MKERPKYLHEIYTKDDIDLVSDVKLTYNCGYCPIVLRAPEQSYTCCGWLNCHGKSFPADFRTHQGKAYTLKLKYAIEVWNMAAAVVLEKNRIPKSFEIKWIDGNGYYRELISANPHFEQYKQEFWASLE
jgi:hypothetical protein